jgi:hypothetical protein
MICRNGLHELDPADSWRSSNGARCRECYIGVQDRYNESHKGQERRWRYEDSQRGRLTRLGYAWRRDARRRRETLEARKLRLAEEFAA